SLPIVWLRRKQRERGSGHFCGLTRSDNGGFFPGELERQVLVLNFSQCHGHGWCRSAQPALRYVGAWMIGLDFQGSWYCCVSSLIDHHSIYSTANG
ncbi:hypothetical protein EJ110_NYTH28199, partial [Nymphaea thermarum]